MKPTFLDIPYFKEIKPASYEEMNKELANALAIIFGCPRPYPEVDYMRNVGYMTIDLRDYRHLFTEFCR